MSSRPRTGIAIGALATLLVAGASSTSTAASPDTTPTPTPHGHALPSSPTLDATDQATLEALQKLAEHQKPVQIAAIVNSDRPADLLVDDNDQVIAAAYDTTASPSFHLARPW